MGPGLNAASMDALGWLDPSRVRTTSGDSIHVPVRLRPLHRRDLQGFLAARLGQYYIEFRDKDRWDQGISEPVVFVHRFDDSHSYLMPGRLGVPGLRAGDSFGDGLRDPSRPNFTSVLRVEVVAVDPDAKFADVQLTFERGLSSGDRRRGSAGRHRPGRRWHRHPAWRRNPKNTAELTARGGARAHRHFRKRSRGTVLDTPAAVAQGSAESDCCHCRGPPGINGGNP